MGSRNRSRGWEDEEVVPCLATEITGLRLSILAGQFRIGGRLPQRYPRAAARELA
mgnify:CR=1 FL=1